MHTVALQYCDCILQSNTELSFSCSCVGLASSHVVAGGGALS